MLVARTVLAACTAAGIARAWRQRRVLSWWTAFWLNIPDNCGAECRWWLQAKNWLYFFDQFAGGLQDLPAQSLGLMDWIFDVGTQLPYSARELWRAAFVEVPRQVPAALREDLDPLPRRPASLGIPPRPTRPPPVPLAFHDGRILADSMSPRPTGTAPEQPTLESPARNDVHPPANASQNCDQEWTLAQSGDGLAPAERVQPTVADNQTSASSHECFALPACPDHVVASDSTTTEIAGRANDKGSEHSFANASTAVASDTAVQTPTEGSGVTDIKPILPPMLWSCHDCGGPLSWNADWRCEEGVYFCKKCWKEFDNRWWETTSKDVIDVEHGIHDSDRVAKHAGSVMDPVDSGAIARARTAVGTKLLQLLAPHFGGNATSCASGAPPLAASIVGIDSLAILTLCRSIRLASPGLILRPQDVFQCSTVGDLLTVVEAQADAAALKVAVATSRSDVKVGESHTSSERAVFFAPPQYTGTCKWLYGCKGLLREDSFRVAAARLIARHEGLHAELADGPDLGIELVRFLKEGMTLHSALWPEVERTLRSWPVVARVGGSTVVNWARNAAAWSFKGSWPRSRPADITQEFLDERVRVIRCQTWRQVEEASMRIRDSFTPPFIMALFLMEPAPSMYASVRWPGPSPSSSLDDATDQRFSLPHEWQEPTSFIQFVASHAFTDGYCSVPLIQDFATLYARVEALRQGFDVDGADTTLAPLPRGACFDDLQERLFATLDGRSKWAVPNQMSMRPTCFDGPWAPQWSPWCYNHEILLEQGAVASLQRSAGSYGVPFEVALLSLFLAATFRASAAETCSTSDGRSREATTARSLPLTLYAPMRDGDLNDAMLGLFSDWRDCMASCDERTTLLGFCLDVADTIRHRRWTVFDPFQNSERILVNILPLDEQPRGGQGFRQTRAHEYGGRRFSAPRERKSWRGPHRPMRVTLEQESPEAWWLSLDINASRYSTTWCRGFVTELRRSIEELAQVPLTPVLRP